MAKQRPRGGVKTASKSLLNKHVNKVGTPHPESENAMPPDGEKSKACPQHQNVEADQTTLNTPMHIHPDGEQELETKSVKSPLSVQPCYASECEHVTTEVEG